MIFRAILVCTDLTRQSERALRIAAALTQETGAALVAIHVVPLPQRLMQWSAPLARSESKVYRNLVAGRMDAARVEIESQLRRVWGRRHDGEAVVVAGSPAETVASTGDRLGADLIVVGRGGGGALGSTAERIVRMVGRTVLVAPVSPSGLRAFVSSTPPTIAGARRSRRKAA